MLPSFLYPSYTQYKRDTDDVAAWLADTAKRCGFPSDSLSTTAPQPPQKAPKLKGRARKLARDAAKAANKNIQEINGESKIPLKAQQYLISVNNFVTLAEWIAKSVKPAVKMPSTFVSVLDRAIAVRKQHIDWWYNQGSNKMKSSKSGKDEKEGHSHFVGVLEQVRDILRPHMVSKCSTRIHSQQSSDVYAKNKSSDEHFLNQFANIHVEHLPEESLDPLLATQQLPLVSAPMKTYGVQQPNDTEEVCFAVHCLLNDFGNIRRYVQQVWLGYKQGVFDLIAASLTTNTAIDFARRLLEDFVEMFPEYTDFQENIGILLMQLNVRMGYEPDYRGKSNDEMNFELYEEADKFLYPAYLLVSSFSDVSKDHSLPIFKPGQFGIYDATSKRELKSSRDRFREDKVLLLESLPDFWVFAHVSNKIPAEDEMTRGVREMTEQDSPPFWLALAAQIFLDIHHALREEVSAGFSDLVKSARYVENSIQQVILFHENLHVQTWPKFNDKAFQHILDLINTWVNNDALQVGRAKLSKISQCQLPAVEPYRFLKNHPLYCGLLSFYIKTLAQEDMDFALFVHKPEDIFIGSFPNNILDYLKRYILAMGGSAMMFANNRRREDIVISKAGPRGLDHLAPVSAIFRSRWCDGNNRTDLSPADVEIILQASNGTGDDTLLDNTGDRTVPRVKIDVTKRPSSATIIEEQRMYKVKRRNDLRQSAAAGLRPIQLLDALLRAIQCEIPELSFDHLHLHKFSWQLLRAVYEALDDDLRDVYGVECLQEDYLPYVVGFIFTTAVNVSKLPGPLLPKKQKNVVISHMLIRAAEVMKEMLDTGAGETELKSLKDFLGIEIDVPDIFGTPEPSPKRA